MVHKTGVSMEVEEYKIVGRWYLMLAMKEVAELKKASASVNLAGAVKRARKKMVVFGALVHLDDEVAACALVHPVSLHRLQVVRRGSLPDVLLLLPQVEVVVGVVVWHPRKTGP
jgi:hypothetical protein